MKIRLSLLLLTSSLLLSCVSSNKNIIIGDITGLEKGDKVYLATETNFLAPIVVDSMIIEQDGHFNIETPITDTYTHLFMVKKGEKLDLGSISAELFIEGFSTINIHGDIENLKCIKRTGGIYSMPEFEEIKIIADSLAILFYQVFGDSNYIKITDSTRIILDIIDRIGAPMDSLRNNFRENNPDAAYSAYLLRRNSSDANGDLKDYETLYNKLSPRVKASAEGKSIEAYISRLKSLAVGSKAPDFKAKDILGNDISLSDFKGKHLLLEYWTTGCGACLMYSPLLVDIYEKAKGDNFGFISIAVNERSESYLLELIAEKEKTWRNINDTKGEISSAYCIDRYPRYVLIDPEGKIVISDHPNVVIPIIENIIKVNSQN